MPDTVFTERLDDRTVSLLFVTVVALTFVDVALGRTLFDTTLPALVADLGVAAAVLCARRHLLVAALLAAAASTALSAAVAASPLDRWPFGDDWDRGNRFVGLGAWPGLAELAGMAVLGALAIRHRPAGEATAAAGAYAAALLAIVAWRQEGIYGELFFMVLAVVGAATVATGLYSRSIEQRRADESRAARQSERDAIARELHDLVAHHVTGIVVQAQAAKLVADRRPEVTAAALADIERAGAEALSSMRAMVGALRADTDATPITPTATLDDIRALATPAGAALPVAVTLDARAERLPGSVVASLHRIAIEALTNVRRHGAAATGVEIAVVCSPDHVTLSVTNDGAVVTDRQQGFGLVGIAERVAAFGGRFSAGPRPEGGWLVTAELPTREPGPA